jgi:hypothetical protein
MKSQGISGKIYVVGETGLNEELIAAGYETAGFEDGDRRDIPVPFVIDSNVKAVVVGLDRYASTSVQLLVLFEANSTRSVQQSLLLQVSLRVVLYPRNPWLSFHRDEPVRILGFLNMVMELYPWMFNSATGALGIRHSHWIARFFLVVAAWSSLSRLPLASTVSVISSVSCSQGFGEF